MADEIKQQKSLAVSNSTAVRSRTTQSQVRKQQESLAHGWLRSHQQAVGVFNYAKPQQAALGIASMPNKTVAALGGQALAHSHLQAVQQHVSEEAFLSLQAPEASLGSIWSLLPPKVAQKILQERGDAIMKSLMEWGEDIRMNAKLAKEASEKAQQLNEREQKVQLNRTEATRSARVNRKSIRLIKAATKLVRSLPTHAAVPAETWVRVSDAFDSKENATPLAIAGKAGSKRAQPDEPDANENTGVQLQRRRPLADIIN